MRRLARCVFALVACAVPAGAGAAPARLGPAVERFENLRLADGGSASVHDMRLSIGHLEILLASGRAAAVQAGGETVGIYFEGSGTLAYRCAEPLEWPVVAFNLRKSTGLQAQRSAGELTIKDSFERLLWVESGRPVPALPKPDGSSLDASFQRHHGHFRRARVTPLSHAFAIQTLDAPRLPLVRATLAGGREDLLYAYDEALERSEALLQMRKSESDASAFRRFLWPVVLSEQPIGRDRRDPALPRFLLTDVELDLTASDGRDASYSVVESLVPQGSPQSVFRLELYNETYDLVGAGIKTRAFRVRRVTGEGGDALEFDHRDDGLLVALPSAVDAGRPAKIRVEVEGDFLVRPGGDNFWLLGVEPWFPQPSFGGQYYTLRAKVRVPKPFVPFAPGVTVARRTEGPYNVLETRIENPVQFAVVLAGKYEFEEQTKNGVTVRVATYALKNSRATKQLAELAFGIIEYYQKFLGPFPFPELNILEINDYGFGQAPPGVVFITKEAFNPLMGELNQLFSQGINERFAHEIAHQYWGHVVKMPGEEEQWLTESFASYSAALFLKALKGKATYDRLLRHWKARADYATEASPIPLANRVFVPNDPMTRFAIRTGLIYDKGAYLLARLHEELGDQIFLTFLKSYQKTFRWKFGTTKQVEAMLEWISKKDHGPFFESNYWGTGMPGR